MEETPKKKLSFNVKLFSNIVIAISSALIIFLVGFRVGQFSINSISDSPSSKYNVENLEEGNVTDLDFSLFWETWNALEDYYIDRGEIEPKDLYYGAIKGMVAALGDSYTYFLSPEEFQQSKEDLEGTFEGIGAELGLRQGQIVIVSPLKDSPAEKAGALPGDVITKVDGEDATEWTLYEAVTNIRGPRGEEVVLTVYRPSIQDEQDISIIRDKINIKFVEVKYENNIAVIELSRFGENTIELWDQAVREITQRNRQGNLDGIVLDMRGNPGGFLEGAIYIATDFLNRGELIISQEYSDQSPDEFRADRDGRLVGIPTVVLINEGSASASEIVAGALRDNDKAKLVGMTSFGKGTVQQVFDLQQDAGIHITISRWVLPDGDWIHENGIEPDVEIDNEIEEGNTRTRETDKQLDKAIELLRE